jgi:hypothetical protein
MTSADVISLPEGIAVENILPLQFACSLWCARWHVMIVASEVHWCGASVWWLSCCCLLREGFVFIFVFINFCKTFSLLIHTWQALVVGSSKKNLIVTV